MCGSAIAVNRFVPSIMVNGVVQILVRLGCVNVICVCPVAFGNSIARIDGPFVTHPAPEDYKI